MLRNRARKAPSQHIFIWCTVPYGLQIINATFPVSQKIFWDTLYKINYCFESVRSIQRCYDRTEIFQIDYSITYKLAFSPYWSCCLTFMSRGLYTGQILAPNLTSHTIMAFLLRTSLISYWQILPPNKEYTVRFFFNMKANIWLGEIFMSPTKKYFPIWERDLRIRQLWSAKILLFREIFLFLRIALILREISGFKNTFLFSIKHSKVPHKRNWIFVTRPLVYVTYKRPFLKVFRSVGSVSLEIIALKCISGFIFSKLENFLAQIS